MKILTIMSANFVGTPELSLYNLRLFSLFPLVSAVRAVPAGHILCIVALFTVVSPEKAGLSHKKDPGATIRDIIIV
ncbi:MAG: hypothetical protein IJT43_00505 [Stomatobaculum sp.]|nr:hypothetical protein [Stomatobaculum sp.]